MEYTLDQVIDKIDQFSDNALFNAIIDSDSYKTSHWPQYPKGTKKVVSYLESRGGMFQETVQFGFTYTIKKYLVGVVITHEMIDVAKAIIVAHMGGIPENFNEAGWRYIVDECGGKLPLKIDILPEGYRVGIHNALAVITNTDDNCYWLVNYIETMFLRTWYPITVATLSYEIKKVIAHYLEVSGTPESIDFKLQDFGSRGVTCREQAQIGGAAHLVNFMGSDTMIAIPTILKYYNGDKMPAYSVPASEHSTMTSWGRDNETAAVKNMLDIYPKGIVSIVADSYDVFNFAENIIGKVLKAQVQNREGVVVIRPDSSDGVKYTIDGIIIKLFDILEAAFGSAKNNKGYKVLPPYIRVLQGDGMNYGSLSKLCDAIVSAGWSLDNIACFGMGGKLLQGVDRDTQKFAIKCCAICTETGEWIEVFKDPITDPGKKSIRGIPSVTYTVGVGFRTNPTKYTTRQFGERLVNVFLNGELTKDAFFGEIRTNVNKDHFGIRVVGANYSRDEENVD